MRLFLFLSKTFHLGSIPPRVIAYANIYMAQIISDNMMTKRIFYVFFIESNPTYCKKTCCFSKYQLHCHTACTHVD